MATCQDESATAYLRIAAISIALYDGLWTIPAEIALYRQQKSLRQMTRACILFILIRYTSILVIVISNIGFFDHSFTARTCLKFYLIAPALKAIQTMVSQMILAVRTVAVARQARWVMWTVGVLFVAAVGLEYFSNIWRRIPIQEPAGPLHANCTSGNSSGFKIAWVHYLAAMIYDATCLAIVTGYIYGQSRSQPGHSLDVLSKLLLKEGVLYFCLLTGVNVLNLVLYATSSNQSQSAGATLGYATTWIMSQRLLIHLQGTFFKTNSRARSRSRSLSNSAKPRGLPGFLAPRAGEDTAGDVELGIHVTIEEAFKVDYDQDIVGDLASPHRITTARIEKEHRRREDRKKKKLKEMNREDSGDEGTQIESKGWEVTSVGKIFSP